MHTTPKLNIAPEKLWLEDYFPIGKVTFQGLSETSGGYKFQAFPSATNMCNLNSCGFLTAVKQFQERFFRENLSTKQIKYGKKQFVDHRILLPL